MQARLIEELSIGTELEIVNAARKSFDIQHNIFTDKDENLIKFLIREGHWLPFRHPQLSFECEVPIFVARQLGKHQVGLTWSEISRRYKTTRMKFWNDPVFRSAPENIKQGTGNKLNVFKQKTASLLLRTITNISYIGYTLLLKLGVAPEQARAVLPQSMYIYYTWTGSLLAWIHLVKQRTHKDTQLETKEFVTKFILPEIAKKFPITYSQLVSDWNE